VLREVILPGGANLAITAGIPEPRRTRHRDTFQLAAMVGHRAETEESVVQAALAATRRVPLTGVELAGLEEQMPLTSNVSTLLPAGTLAGAAPMLVIHHMLDFVAMVKAIVGLGVPPGLLTVLDKGYPYRTTERVDATLAAMGVRVWHHTEALDALADHAARARAAGRRASLADDGGYTLPLLLSDAPDLLSEYHGLVEQTKSGIFRLERFDGIPMPIFSVAESELKATIEGYGIADAAARNTVALLPDEKWEGKPVLVLGFGRIGQQVAEVLRARRMRVAVFDSDIVALVAAHERGFVTRRSVPALIRDHRPRLIVGTSGRTSLRGDHVAHLAEDVYVVSVTSRQREFALAEFADGAVAQEDLGRLGIRYVLPSGRAVTALADGFPVNFHHAESLPNRYSDVIVGAMIIGIATLARPDHGFAHGHNVARTNAALAASGLVERYYRLHGPSDA
jgi:S-adenosylhomocysteine hydrolase